jgi:hypothetical protein
MQLFSCKRRPQFPLEKRSSSRVLEMIQFRKIWPQNTPLIFFSASIGLYIHCNSWSRYQAHSNNKCILLIGWGVATVTIHPFSRRKESFQGILCDEMRRMKLTLSHERSSFYQNSTRKSIFLQVCKLLYLISLLHFHFQFSRSQNR